MGVFKAQSAAAVHQLYTAKQSTHITFRSCPKFSGVKDRKALLQATYACKCLRFGYPFTLERLRYAAQAIPHSGWPATAVAAPVWRWQCGVLKGAPHADQRAVARGRSAGGGTCAAARPPRVLAGTLPVVTAPATPPAGGRATCLISDSILPPTTIQACMAAWPPA